MSIQVKRLTGQNLIKQQNMTTGAVEFKEGQPVYIQDYQTLYVATKDGQKLAETKGSIINNSASDLPSSVGTWLPINMNEHNMSQPNKFGVLRTVKHNNNYDGLTGEYTNIPNSVASNWILHKSTDPESLESITSDKYGVETDRNGIAYVEVPRPTATNFSLGIVKGGLTSDQTYGISVSNDGSMTVDVPWTDTKVTAVDNHYTPIEDSAAQISDIATGATVSANWGETSLVTGVKLNRDSKGHVVGVSVTSVKMPSNPDTNTAHAHTVGVGLVKTGDGGTSGTVDYKAALADETLDACASVARTPTTNLSGKPNSYQYRIYPVIADKNGKLAVIVPWSDTTYSAGKNLELSSYTFKLSDAISLTSVTASGQIQAQTFNATSDKRLKENIESFNCKKSILDLPVYTFNFKSDENKIKHVGCLAQDLQEICPELVHENNDGYLSIEENKLVYLLLDEVKKLKAQIIDLVRD